MPLLMLKNGDAEEKDGEMRELLVNANDTTGYPPAEKDPEFAVREPTWRILRCLLDFVDEA